MENTFYFKKAKKIITSSMQYKKYLLQLFVFFTLLSPFLINAQEDKKRFAMVSLDRFSFESHFDLKEIAALNQLNVAEEAFSAYQKKIIERLSVPLEGYQFFELPAENQVQLLRNSLRVYKDEPITHYGYDLSWSTESDYLNQLLTNFSADYIVFISLYSITKKTLLTPQAYDGSKFIPWSRHSISYEVYNKEGKLIALSDGFDILQKLPTESTYTSQGLLLSGMNNAFLPLQKDIIQKTLKYSDKPIHRLKKKEVWK